MSKFLTAHQFVKWTDLIIENNLYYLDTNVINNLTTMSNYKNELVAKYIVPKFTSNFSELLNKELVGNKKDKVYYYYDIFYEEWLSYLKSIKSVEVYNFKTLKISLSEKIDKVLEKYGHPIDYSLDLNDTMKIVIDSIDKNGVILYELTHTSDTYKSILSTISDVNEPFFDSIFKTDDSYFTKTKIMILNNVMIYLKNLSKYLVNEKVDSLIFSLKSYVKVLDEEYSINDDFLLEQDFDYL